jgi:hypothetical protein
MGDDKGGRVIEDFAQLGDDAFFGFGIQRRQRIIE